MYADASKKSTIASSNIPKLSKNATKSPSANEILHGTRSSRQLEPKLVQVRDHSPEKRGLQKKNPELFFFLILPLLNIFVRQNTSVAFEYWETRDSRLCGRSMRFFSFSASSLILITSISQEGSASVRHSSF
jgi:hypothetical protein